MSRKPRILIVDDLPANIHVIAEALGPECELFFANDGEQALRRAARGDLDLVLLDVEMPGLDGIAVCRRLKRAPATAAMPVIFVTARSEISDETRGFEAGGVDYITKPVSPPIVRARVHTHLELKRARDLLERMNAIDGLTGIANRRRFDTMLEQEWSRAFRGRRWLTVGIADIDHFKRFNDRYGHVRGDACLRAVAVAVAGAISRPGDLAARYGGEEFGLVVPETDVAGAAVLTAGLLDAVARLAIEHADSPTGDRLGISLGAVCGVPTDETSPAEMLEIADQMLYEAKKSGRNRAIVMDRESGEKRVVLAVESPGAREGGES